MADRKRVPPHALDAEIAVLAGILIDPRAIAIVEDALSPEDFYAGSHAVVYRAAIGLHKSGTPVDLVTVAGRLKDMAALDEVGGATMLSSLVDSMPTSANIAAHARMVRDKSRLRSVLAAATEIAEKGYDANLDVSQYLNEAQNAIYRAAKGSSRTLSRVGKYIAQAGTQQFSASALSAWLGLKSADEREEMADILVEMEREGSITRVGSRQGVYRGVDRSPHTMQLWQGNDTPLRIELPLGLHEIVNLYSRNVILIAGEKDAGKTAMSLNAAYLNRDRMTVKYFNSEMGAKELETRLDLFGYDRKEWRKIQFVERATKFEDLIDPDGFNIIDFLEVGAEAYAVVEDIRRCFDRLDKGLILIVMQKRSYKDYAVGGEGTLEKARLAVNLERREPVGSVCRITVAKNWTGKIRSPRGWECRYKVFSGGRIESAGIGWYDPDVEEAINEHDRPRGFTGRKQGKAFVHES